MSLLYGRQSTGRLETEERKLGHKGAGSSLISKPTGLRVAWEVPGFLEKGRVLAARDGLWRGGEERGMCTGS